MFGLTSIGVGALILFLVLWPSQTQGKSRLDLFLNGLGYNPPDTGSSGGSSFDWKSLLGGSSWGGGSAGGPGASSGFGGDTTPDVQGSGSGADAVRLALQELGTPYVWGGSAIGGFDCSGLTQWAYAKEGIHLPRTAQQQYNIAKPTSSPSVGDLVFFTGTYNTGDFISHVGMYLGNGKMVSAQNGGVLVGDLTSGYWAQHLVSYGKVS